jgi:protein TonB
VGFVSTGRVMRAGADSSSSSPQKEKARADQGPVLISMPKPQYPFEMRRQGIHGDVFVEFTIDVEGSVHDAKVVSAPHKDLHAPALAAIVKAKFRPAMKDGRPVPVKMRLPIVFSVR